MELRRRVADLKSAETEWVRAEEEAGFKHEQLLSIFDSIDEVIYVADPDTYELLYFNNAFRLRWKGKTGDKCHKVLQNMDAPCDFCSNKFIFGENLEKTHIWELRNLVDRHWYRCIDKAIKWPDGRWVRVEIAVDITERVQAEEALENYAQQLVTINRVTTVLSSSLALDEVLELILTHIKSFIPYDNAAIFLAEEDGKLRIFNAAGYAREFLGKAFRLEETIMCALDSRAQPVVLTDAQADPRFVKWENAEPIHGWMCIPLSSRDTLIGYLTLDSDQKGLYTQEHVRLAQLFGAKAAQAIANARLHERVIQDANEMEKRVRERTESLQKFVNLTAGREIRMAELKKIIKALRVQLQDAGMQPVTNDPLTAGPEE